MESNITEDIKRRDAKTLDNREPLNMNINEKEIERFLSDMDAQALKKPFVKLIRESYVSTEGFLKSFDDCVHSFDRDIKNTPWILIIPNKKGVGGSND